MCIMNLFRCPVLYIFMSSIVKAERHGWCEYEQFAVNMNSLLKLLNNSRDSSIFVQWRHTYFLHYTGVVLLAAQYNCCIMRIVTVGQSKPSTLDSSVLHSNWKDISHYTQTFAYNVLYELSPWYCDCWHKGTLNK